MIQSRQPKLVIKDTPLKQFLQLFEPQDLIQVEELGDTWHPSDSYVDEKILHGCKTVQDLIDFDYDFKGLVLFKATIGDFEVYYSDLSGYKVIGSKKSIETLFRKIETFNISPHAFKFEILEGY